MNRNGGGAPHRGRRPAIPNGYNSGSDQSPARRQGDSKQHTQARHGNPEPPAFTEEMPAQGRHEDRGHGFAQRIGIKVLRRSSMNSNGRGTPHRGRRPAIPNGYNSDSDQRPARRQGTRNNTRKPGTKIRNPLHSCQGCRLKAGMRTGDTALHTESA